MPNCSVVARRSARVGIDMKITKPLVGSLLRHRAGDPGRKFSAILTDIAGDETLDRVSVADLLGAMGDRAFGPLLFVFALPNVLPSPPGTSGLLGIPLIFLAVQLMLGRKPWLPGIIAARSMSREGFAGIINRATPWLAKAERMLRPRLGILVHPPAEYLIGGLVLLLALVLALPIPFVNATPAFTICLLALGILERDGVWVLAGAAMAVVSLVLAVLLGYTVIVAALMVFTRAFG